MKKKYLPIIALAAGFIWAFITAGVHSILFAFLPLLAFAFGYFSSWRWGLLNGFLLFIGYTFATALMWRGDLYSGGLSQYFSAFILGGFSLLLLGALASVVKRGIRKIGSVLVLIILAFFMVWCGFQAWPAYSYYYQVSIHSSENLEDLELYLPAGVVSEDLYQELYDHPYPFRMPGSLTDKYTKEIMETEHGPMLKLAIPELMQRGPRGYPYTGNIIFWQPGGFRNTLIEMVIPWQRESAPHQLIKLMPRYDAVPVNRVKSQGFIGPVKTRESLVVEEFKVPVMIKSATDADFEFRLENRTGRGGWINFGYSKSNTYTELIKYEGSTGDEWLLVPVEVTDRLSIRGIGD